MNNINRQPFAHKEIEPGVYIAKLDHVWRAAKHWAKTNGKEVTSCVVQGIAPL